MGNNKNKKTRLNARFVLFLSCTLILCVMVTFGITLSYFGGKSQGYSAEFILKAGIEFKKETDAEIASGVDYQSVNFSSDYMVPGTVLNATCLMTITSGVADIENTAVNGLLRTNFVIDGEMKNFLSIDESNPIYVYIGSSSADMIDANKLGRIIKAEDGYFYLVDNDTISISNSTMLSEVPCTTNSGEVSLIFNVPVIVNNISSDKVEFTNSHMDKEANFTANFQVVQSEFYSTSTEPDEINYENSKQVFDSAMNYKASQ